MRGLVVDIETDGDPWDGELVALGAVDLETGAAGVWRGDAVPSEVFAALRDDTPIITHTKYDARWLRLHGWKVSGPFHDTQVMAWVLNENQPLDLANLASRYCGINMDKRIKRVNGQPLFHTDDDTWVPIKDAPWDQMKRYNLGDIEGTAELYVTLHELLDETAWESYWSSEETPFTDVLLGMECAGLPVDLEASEELRAELEVDHERMAADLRAGVSLPEAFNIGSGDQLAVYLFSKRFEYPDALPWGPENCASLKECMAGEHEQCEVFDIEECSWHPNHCIEPSCPACYCISMGQEYHFTDFLPPGFTVTSVGRDKVHGVWSVKGRGLSPGAWTEGTENKVRRPSTRTPDLLTYNGNDEWVKDLVAYRKVDKVLTTYLRPFPRLAHEGRLYGRFNQTGTKTGRLSSSGPNMQNMPAHGNLGPKVRALFKGNLIVGDYSQLEPRLMAHFSQDPALLDIYRSGKDLYIEMALAVLGERVEKEDPRRQMMKTYTLGLGYGAYEKTLQKTLALNGFWMPLDEVASHLDNLREWLGGFFEWKEGIVRYVHQKGYVTTIGGRHRRLKASFKDRKNWKNIGYGERQAVNAIIQGSAGDIVRRAMLKLHNEGLHELLLLAQVHDELVWEWNAHYKPSVNQLQEIRDMAENVGFDLDLPLVFEPSFCHSWAEKGGKHIELPEDMGEDDAT